MLQLVKPFIEGFSVPSIKEEPMDTEEMSEIGSSQKRSIDSATPKTPGAKPKHKKNKK